MRTLAWFLQFTLRPRVDDSLYSPLQRIRTGCVRPAKLRGPTGDPVGGPAFDIAAGQLQTPGLSMNGSNLRQILQIPSTDAPERICSRNDFPPAQKYQYWSKNVNLPVQPAPRTLSERMLLRNSIEVLFVRGGMLIDIEENEVLGE
jgi:hypothetical protein